MKRARKALVVATKSLLALALLAWVVSQVHWRDYVTERGTERSFAILEKRAEEGACTLRLAEGMLWWRSERLEPCERFAPAAGGGLTSPGVATSLRDLRLGLVAAAVAAYLLFLGILSIRWWLLLRAAESPMTLWQATRLNFLGLFFSTFMPGSVGGDVVKAYYAVRGAPNKAAALVSIALDRLLGLLGFALVAAAACAVAVGAGVLDVSHVGRAVLSSAVVTVTIAGSLTLLLSARLRRFFRLGTLFARVGLARITDSLGEAARLYEHHLARLAWPGVITLISTLVLVASLALLGGALGMQTAWHTYVLYVPLITIIAAVPLTPGGLGFVEQLYLFYFASAACGPSQILTFVLLIRVLSILCSLPGALELLAGTRVPAPAEVG